MQQWRGVQVLLLGSVRYRAMAAADTQRSRLCRLLSSSTRNKCSSYYPGHWKRVDGTTVATATGGVAPPCDASALVSTTVATAGMAPPPAAGSTATAVATRLFCGYATGTSACSTGCSAAQYSRSLVHSRCCSGHGLYKQRFRTCVTYTVDGSFGSTNAAWTKVPAATACVNSDATGVAMCVPHKHTACERSDVQL